MIDRCHYIFDRDVGRVLIPGCMGSAVYGKDGCTCPEPPMPAKRVGEIEDRLAGIEAALASLLQRLPVAPAQPPGAEP